MALGQSEAGGNGPVVFLDKDGTLVRDVPYNIHPDQIILEKGAANGLRRLAEAGFRFVVVSNQSGVARGYFKEEALKPVETRLRQLLEDSAGVELAGFYYCPHHPDGTVAEYAIECSCRKPQPGLLLAAANDLRIDLDEAWMIGDILNDVEAGHRAGCRTILINNGNETEWKRGPNRAPDFIVTDLERAAQIILEQSGQTASRKKEKSVQNDQIG
jgi:D-glycero-D-manno-heptose 1,7-bisphosphate phosphatase